ncbi:MAG: terminase small subunit [Clostridium sp.]|nr:terminase small subunit [[Clostridium] innocuum]QSI25286.1 terminase small subunit [Erysipelotrichaceae bacterium 66202529]DAQ27836.1 MAG TPA: Terminase small subunit [Caudoviricetes sp.]
MKINEKQKAFVLYLCKDNLSQTDAYIKAGYSPKGARAGAARLLTNVSVQEYMKKVMKKVEDKKIADIKEVMEFYTAVMRGAEKDQFGLDAALRDRLDASKELVKRLEKIDDKNTGDEKVMIINDI